MQKSAEKKLLVAQKAHRIRTKNKDLQTEQQVHNIAERSSALFPNQRRRPTLRSSSAILAGTCIHDGDYRALVELFLRLMFRSGGINHFSCSRMSKGGTHPAPHPGSLFSCSFKRLMSALSSVLILVTVFSNCVLCASLDQEDTVHHHNHRQCSHQHPRPHEVRLISFLKNLKFSWNQREYFEQYED